MTKLWEPSNGSESEYMWIYCEHCERDRASWPVDQGGQDSPEDGCRILAEFGMDGRHEAWIVDENGYPKCLKFIEEAETPEEGAELIRGYEEDTETLPLFPDM
jgi:hypothetical protein